MAQVIEPTNDAGYMVANRIEPVLASSGTSIYAQQKESVQNSSLTSYLKPRPDHR